MSKTITFLLAVGLSIPLLVIISQTMFSGNSAPDNNVLFAATPEKGWQRLVWASMSDHSNNNKHAASILCRDFDLSCIQLRMTDRMRSVQKHHFAIEDQIRHLQTAIHGLPETSAFKRDIDNEVTRVRETSSTRLILTTIDLLAEVQEAKNRIGLTPQVRKHVFNELERDIDIHEADVFNYQYETELLNAKFDDQKRFGR